MSLCKADGLGYVEVAASERRWLAVRVLAAALVAVKPCLHSIRVAAAASERRSVARRVRDEFMALRSPSH